MRDHVCKLGLGRIISGPFELMRVMGVAMRVLQYLWDVGSNGIFIEIEPYFHCLNGEVFHSHDSKNDTSHLEAKR